MCGEGEDEEGEGEGDVEAEDDGSDLAVRVGPAPSSLPVDAEDELEGLSGAPQAACLWCPLPAEDASREEP